MTTLFFILSGIGFTILLMGFLDIKIPFLRDKTYKQRMPADHLHFKQRKKEKKVRVYDPVSSRRINHKESADDLNKMTLLIY